MIQKGSAIAIVLAAFLGVSVGAGAGRSGEAPPQASPGTAAAGDDGCQSFGLAPDGRFAGEFAKIDAYLNGRGTGR